MRLIFIILILSYSLTSPGQQKVANDSSTVQQRSFEASSLSTYRNNKDFQYEKELIETQSIWDKFWIWFWHKYDEIMSTETGRITIKILYFLFGIAAIVFFLNRVTNMSRMNLFIANAPEKIPYTVEEEDINSIPFHSAIEKASGSGNYRLAVRLLYLQSLKLLADKNFINWQSNKTNTHYLREISNTGLQQTFEQITDVFEYTWYGNLAVTGENFAKIKDQFLKFQSQL